MISIISQITKGLAVGFAIFGCVLAVPFLIVAGILFKVADDLDGEWRRGRRQNALWRWARRWSGKP